MYNLRPLIVDSCLIDWFDCCSLFYFGHNLIQQPLKDYDEFVRLCIHLSR